MSPKGETKHLAKFLPGDDKGEPFPWGLQREGVTMEAEVDFFQKY